MEEEKAISGKFGFEWSDSNNILYFPVLLFSFKINKAKCWHRVKLSMEVDCRITLFSLQLYINFYNNINISRMYYE